MHGVRPAGAIPGRPRAGRGRAREGAAGAYRPPALLQAALRPFGSAQDRQGSGQAQAGIGGVPLASPGDLKYTKEHEWVRVDGGAGTVGITDYAQDQLGDIVYVDLPDVGTQVTYLEKLGEIESVKAVSELFSPVSGEVVEVNGALTDKPELVNESPYGDGWMLRVRLSDPAELDNLLTAQQYDDYVSQAQEQG